ncbi:MAG: glycoside hydrolase family 95-like protein, partial [Duganella sp.]
LLARGGFEVGMRWRDGGLRSATIVSPHGGPVTVRSLQKIIVKDTKAESRSQHAAGRTWHLTTFQTEPGKTYALTALQ